jgi:lipoyl(octanoyl) transferase
MIVVRRGSEVLVLHRSPEGDAYWHTVAGAVEEGESWAEAAVRELEEEIGLRVPVVDLEREYAYPLAQESERSRSRFAPGIEQVVVRCFAVEAPPGWEPTLNEEHDDYRWCSPSAAAELLYWPEPGELVLTLDS